MLDLARKALLHVRWARTAARSNTSPAQLRLLPAARSPQTAHTSRPASVSQSDLMA